MPAAMKAESKKKTVTKSSSTSTTTPVKSNPQKVRLSSKSLSNSSTCSTGSVCLATPPACTLTVPDLASSIPSSSSASSKVSRATSPLNIKARFKRRKDKHKLEKQSNFGLVDDVDEGCVFTETSSSGGSNSVSHHSTSASAKFKRKETNPFSLYFRKNSRDHSQEKSSQPNSLSPRSADSFQYDSLSPNAGPSPEPRSPRSPTSPGAHCRCRRCSLLPLEECEPKEVNMLYRFLKKTKVNVDLFLSSYLAYV